MNHQAGTCPFASVADVVYPSEETQTRPHPFYRLLRDEAPVYRLPGTNTYLVSRYADIVAALKDRDVFSSTRPWDDDAPPEVKAVLAEGWPSPPLLVGEDPPGHTLHRKLSLPAFSPRRIAHIKTRIQGLADELIDSFIARGKADFITEYTELLPVKVIGELFNVPKDAAASFRRWADDSLALMAGGLSIERQLECARNFVAFQQFAATQMEARKLAPDDTLISDLLLARDEDGEKLGDSAIINLLCVFLRAGFETTVQLLGNMVLLLLENPDQFALVRRDRALISKVVEETMRLQSPVQRAFRCTTRDTSIDGVALPAGAQVLLLLGSANHDPEVFETPERFDIRRTFPKPHLGFGNGPHFCLGSGLAREEAMVTLERILERLPNIRLSVDATELRYKPNPILRGLVSLPIEFGRTARPTRNGSGATRTDWRAALRNRRK